MVPFRRSSIMVWDFLSKKLAFWSPLSTVPFCCLSSVIALTNRHCWLLKAFKTLCSPSIYSTWTCRRRKKFVSWELQKAQLVFYLSLSFYRSLSFQIDHFIQAIELNPAVVSLKGYANVNRELLTSVTDPAHFGWIRSISKLVFYSSSQSQPSPFIWLSCCNSNCRWSLSSYQHRLPIFCVQQLRRSPHESSQKWTETMLWCVWHVYYPFTYKSF